MESYNVTEAKSSFSEILDRVSRGEEILLTRRGKPIARGPASWAPAGTTRTSITTSVAADDWWKPMSDDEAKSWCK